MKSISCIVLIVLLGTVICDNPLKSFNVDPKKVSVSGFSAGAFMAVQYQVAFSSQLIGAGILAGGPYYCAQGEEGIATSACMFVPELIDINLLIQDAQQFASQGEIDDLDNLNKHSIWLYSGTDDTIVNPGVMQKLQTFYQSAAPQANVTTLFTFPSAHTFPTLDYGITCTMEISPFVGLCNLDAAGILLKHIYGDLKENATAKSANIFTFDQGLYTQGTDPTSMGLDGTGYYYVPTGCTKGAKCGLHVAFHGCTQSYVNVADAFYGHAGYNEWAESNNIIILYPQAHSVLLWNPEGCFDWWGYTDTNYAFQSGPQLSAVNSMVKALMGK